MILKCNCKNTYQDKIHGEGMRVMNVCKKGAMVRCTSCLKELPNPGKKSEEVKPRNK